MVNHLADFLVFFFEILTLVAAILLVVAGIIALSSKGSAKAKKGSLSVKSLNKRYREQTKNVQREVFSKTEFKRIKQADKASQKAAKLARKKNTKKAEQTAKVFLIRFNGNMMATEVNSLREEITAILGVATLKDEVVVCLESGGGVVHGYGLCASQLQRIKTHKIPLTVCVDKVAASGGYMMASVADKILAAPFAIIGSIGVLAQLPNFHRLLKEKGIDFEQLTAGEYKRTLTLFGKNTPKAREKMQDEINETHKLFKQFIAKNRPSVNLKKAATGEHWFGEDALALGLIDDLMTSDDYLAAILNKQKTRLFEISYQQKKSMGTKFIQGAKQTLNAL